MENLIDRYLPRFLYASCHLTLEILNYIFTASSSLNLLLSSFLSFSSPSSFYPLQLLLQHLLLLSCSFNDIKRKRSRLLDWFKGISEWMIRKDFFDSNTIIHNFSPYSKIFQALNYFLLILSIFIMFILLRHHLGTSCKHTNKCQNMQDWRVYWATEGPKEWKKRPAREMLRTLKLAIYTLL